MRRCNLTDLRQPAGYCRFADTWFTSDEEEVWTMRLCQPAIDLRSVLSLARAGAPVAL